MSKLSVLIITLNEEYNLARCLKSLPKCDEIIVLDSGSSDNTLEIAKSFGAQVSYRKFDNYSAQKNTGIERCHGDWVLCLDADEVLDKKLAEEILKIISLDIDKGPVAYRLKRSLVYMGKKLRFGKTTDYPTRLFRRSLGRFEKSIHEELVLSQGRTVYLNQGILLHYSYKNLTEYFYRFNAYTSALAQTNYQKQKKIFWFGHAMRPWAEFFRRYILTLGFLDGWQGYSFALLSSFYAFVKYEKLHEMYLNEKLGPTHDQ